MILPPPTLERLDLYARALSAAYALADRGESVQAVRMLAAAEMIREDLAQQPDLPPEELKHWLAAAHDLAKGEEG